MWFRYLRALSCSLDIILMVIANLAGFASGGKNIKESPLYPLITSTTPFRFFFIMLFFIPLTFTMFFIRYIEKLHGIKKFSRQYSLF